jgi:hypothetical protein
LTVRARKKHTALYLSSDVPIEDYISKSPVRTPSQLSQAAASSSSSSLSAIASIPSTVAPLTTTIRPLSSIVINTPSVVDDCGRFQISPMLQVVTVNRFSFTWSGLGVLDFDIIWREAFNILTITLIRARGLQAADSNGLSDPYVKLHLVPGVAKVNIDLHVSDRSLLLYLLITHSRQLNYAVIQSVER